MHQLRIRNLAPRSTCSFSHRLRSDISLMVGCGGMDVGFGLHSIQELQVVSNSITNWISYFGERTNPCPRSLDICALHYQPGAVSTRIK